MYLTETSTRVHQKKCARIFTLTLPVIIVPNFLLPKCPTKIELKQKLVYLHNKILHSDGNKWCTIH